MDTNTPVLYMCLCVISFIQIVFDQTKTPFFIARLFRPFTSFQHWINVTNSMLNKITENTNHNEICHL